MPTSLDGLDVNQQLACRQRGDSRLVGLVRGWWERDRDGCIRNDAAAVASILQDVNRNERVEDMSRLELSRKTCFLCDLKQLTARDIMRDRRNLKPPGKQAFAS